MVGTEGALVVATEGAAVRPHATPVAVAVALPEPNREVTERVKRG